MNFTIKAPKTWIEWTIYLITFKFLVTMAIWIYNHRGSSNETKKDMKEIRKALANSITKEDIREIIREENKNFITKDLFEERINRVKEEIVHDYDVKFIKMEAIHEKSILAYDDAKIEHRNGKRRNEEIFLKISERLNGKKRK